MIPRLRAIAFRRAAILLAAASLAAPPSFAQLANPSAAQAAELEDVANRAQAAYDAQEWEEAAELFLRGAELAPQAIASPYLYNAACCLSQMGEVEEAFEMLEQAIEAGFMDSPLVSNDPDLEPVRKAFPGQFPGLIARTQALRRELDEKDPDGFLFTPANYDPAKEYGAVVALHPWGGNPHYMVNLWKPIADERGLILLVVRGANPLGEGRYEWDMPHLGLEAAKVASWLKKTLEQHPNIDQRRLYLTGYSQGGAVACFMGLTSPGIWAGIVSVAAPNPLREALTARALPDRPILLYSIIGDRDKQSFLEFNRALKRQADDKVLKMVLRELPAVGHSLPPYIHAELHKALDWIDAERAKQAEAAAPPAEQ